MNDETRSRIDDDEVDAGALWIRTGLGMRLVRLTARKESIRVIYTIAVAVAILCILAGVFPPATSYDVLNRMRNAATVLFVACFVADMMTRFVTARLSLRYTVLAALYEEEKNHGPQQGDFFDVRYNDDVANVLNEGRPYPFPLSLILSRQSRAGSAALARLRKQGLVTTIGDDDSWVLTKLGGGVARRLDRIHLYPELYEQIVWKGSP